MKLLVLHALVLSCAALRPQQPTMQSTRRAILGGVAAMLPFQPVFAGDEVDEEMLEKMQAARENWKKNSVRRGFAFEPSASMPFVKADTVGAPARDRADAAAAKADAAAPPAAAPAGAP